MMKLKLKTEKKCYCITKISGLLKTKTRRERIILTEIMNGMDGIPLNNNLKLPKFSSPFQVCP